MEQQILDVYNTLINDANCTKYKSNQTIFVGNNFETKTPSRLNLRIVVTKYNAIKTADRWGAYDYPQNLHKASHTFLADLLVIANNLGFEINSSSSHDVEWVSGGNQEFFAARNGKRVLLMTVRAYLNGNIHIKLNKDFNHKLNVLKGKREGWIHSVDDVVNEFEVNENEAKQLFEELPKIAVNIAGFLN